MSVMVRPAVSRVTGDVEAKVSPKVLAMTMTFEEVVAEVVESSVDEHGRHMTRGQIATRCGVTEGYLTKATNKHYPEKPLRGNLIVPVCNATDNDRILHSREEAAAFEKQANEAVTAIMQFVQLMNAKAGIQPTAAARATSERRGGTR